MDGAWTAGGCEGCDVGFAFYIVRIGGAENDVDWWLKWWKDSDDRKSAFLGDVEVWLFINVDVLMQWSIG